MNINISKMIKENQRLNKDKYDREKRLKSIYPDYKIKKLYVDLIDNYAFPGGYSLFYVTKFGEVICSKCCNENIVLIMKNDFMWDITDYDINYESELWCDICSKQIESEYGED